MGRKRKKKTRRSKNMGQGSGTPDKLKSEMEPNGQDAKISRSLGLMGKRRRWRRRKNRQRQKSGTPDEPKSEIEPNRQNAVAASGRRQNRNRRDTFQNSPSTLDTEIIRRTRNKTYPQTPPKSGGKGYKKDDVKYNTAIKDGCDSVEKCGVKRKLVVDLVDVIEPVDKKRRVADVVDCQICRQKDGAIAKLHENIQGMKESHVANEMYKDMKRRYEEEKKAKNEALRRMKESQAAKEMYKDMKRKYEEEMEAKDEALRRMKESQAAKEMYKDMKRKYEEEMEAKDDALRRIKESHVTKEKYKDMKHRYKAEKEAKDDALRRLSAIASSKLRDNNPNISDLSDENRPTKIAEKFSELYDNQWTDAYDALDQTHMAEEDIVRLLLDILKKAFEGCKKLAGEKYFEKVQEVIELPIEVSNYNIQTDVLPKELKQQIKDFRKIRAPKVVDHLFEAVKNSLTSPEYQIPAVEDYTRACVSLCWLMAVQDPPVVLHYPSSDKFDTNMYKDYTKRGPWVEFWVWPALLLHEGGPLLAKGVAQGGNQPPP